MCLPNDANPIIGLTDVYGRFHIQIYISLCIVVLYSYSFDTTFQMKMKLYSYFVFHTKLFNTKERKITEEEREKTTK